MIVDKDIFKITPRNIERLIRRHQRGAARYKLLYDYYMGEHVIKSRRKLSENVPNSRITANHARYIADMSTAYMIANPVTYSASEGYDIEPIKNEYFAQPVSNVDTQLERNAAIFGHAFEIVYADEGSCPRSASAPPQTAFIVYSDGTYREKLCGINYAYIDDIDGNPTGDMIINLYTRDTHFVYKCRTGSIPLLVSKKRHYFGGVPMIEYRNNDALQGDFEQQITLIDAYNNLLSDRVDDKSQFVDCFLLLLGIEIDSERAAELKEQKILMGDTDASAQYLSKIMNESDAEVLQERLKEDIHRFSMVPDLSDDSFANNLSGVAIRYKLMGFEQSMKNKERLFEVGLKERFALYNHFLNVKCNMPIIPLYGIDVEFKRNLPINEYETAQMISLLDGIASRETLLSRLPVDTEAAEEADIIKKEKEEEHDI